MVSSIFLQVFIVFLLFEFSFVLIVQSVSIVDVVLDIVLTCPHQLRRLKRVPMLTW
jgi:hypothetical protein